MDITFLLLYFIFYFSIVEKQIKKNNNKMKWNENLVLLIGYLTLIQQ